MRLVTPSFQGRLLHLQTSTTFTLSIFDKRFSGDHSERVIPDSIPNSVVKPLCADGTAGLSLWESRSLPDSLKGRRARLNAYSAAFFYAISPAVGTHLVLDAP